MTKNPIKREMRRADRQLTREAAMEILENTTHGVLSCVAEDGWPYGTPLSHILLDGALYFHCAPEGLRSDILADCPKVCYTAVAEDRPKLVGESNFTTEYQSAVAFGQAHPVLDEAEKRRILLKLCERFLPEHMDRAARSIEMSLARTAIWRIDIEAVTAKSNIK